MRLVTWALMLPMLRDIFRQIGVRIEIQGAKRAAASPDGGASFEVEPGQGEGLHAWKLVPTSGGEMTVKAGSFNGVAVPEVTELPEGLAYLKVTWTVLSVDGFVYGGTVHEREIVSLATAPDNDPSAGIQYIFIGQVDSGVVVSQVARGGMSARLCDDGTITGTPSFQVLNAGT